MAITKIVTPNSITIFANGKILVAGSTHPNFKAISDTLKDPHADVNKLARMFDIPAAITTMTNGQVEIRGNEVFYDGKVLHSTLTARMLAMLSDGFDISPLVNFLNKLMKNPSHRAVQGLYDFLEATHIPITPDGNFLAYKKVRSNYLDIHSGTIRNAPGDAPRVARNQVDEDPDRTCSHGLHVCSASYLDHFGSSGSSDRIVVVEVDPSDVVAIPRDYNNAKMRCAGYKVIGEVPNGTNAASVFTKAVMSTPDLTPAAPQDGEATAYRDYQSDDQIIDMGGTPVRFVLENGGPYDLDAYDFETWVAYWGGEDLDDEVYHTGCEDLEDAIEDFREVNMCLTSEWLGEARWLDENGDLVTRTVTAETSLDDATERTCTPDNDDFLWSEDDIPDGAVVVYKTLVSSKWTL